MGVKYEHPDYCAMMTKWQRCRHTAAGQDAVHAAGSLYLPLLGEQSNNDYNNYKLRACFFNATWRTIVGLQGMIFRKPPKINAPEVIKEFLNDVTMTGVPFHLFALECVEESLTVGRIGVFVDYPPVDVSITTAADARNRNLRPFMRVYPTESIINWKTKLVNNKSVLSMVVLKEVTPVYKDEFEDSYEDRYRVLDLVEQVNELGKITTLYRVRVFKVESKDGKEVDILLENSIPLINGKMVDYIPFYIMGVDDVTPEVDEPPLIDLVDTNLSHYRTNADYEHGCHFTGLPTPVISGYNPELEDDGSERKFYIGSLTAWVFPNPSAKASYLEFTGQGLEELSKNLSRKENQMAVLGARMLEAQVRAVESANTASIHRSGEQSMLASIAQAISLGLTKALETFAKFAGSSEPVKCELNKDFFPAPMDPLMLTALIAAWQNGAVSYDSLLEKLKQGEIVDPEATIDSELQKIADNPAPVVNAPTTPGNVENQNPKTHASGTGSNPTITQMQKGQS